jgi:hypothetical protein
MDWRFHGLRTRAALWLAPWLGEPDIEVQYVPIPFVTTSSNSAGGAHAVWRRTG